MVPRFRRYVLRSLDVENARAFYAGLFGGSFWDDVIDVAPLPAAAVARGVPGYWLGHIGLEGEWHRKSVAKRAVVGNALARRHLDAGVGLVALGTES